MQQGKGGTHAPRGLHDPHPQTCQAHMGAGHQDHDRLQGSATDLARLPILACRVVGIAFFLRSRQCCQDIQLIKRPRNRYIMRPFLLFSNPLSQAYPRLSDFLECLFNPFRRHWKVEKPCACSIMDAVSNYSSYAHNSRLAAALGRKAIVFHNYGFNLRQP